jgi:hypothetical protein
MARDDPVEIQLEGPIQTRDPCPGGSTARTVDSRVATIEEEIAHVNHAVFDEENDQIAIGVPRARVNQPHGFAANREFARSNHELVREASSPIPRPRFGISTQQMLAGSLSRDDLFRSVECRIPVSVITVIVGVDDRVNRPTCDLFGERSDPFALNRESHRVDYHRTLSGPQYADVSTEAKDHIDIATHLLPAQCGDLPIDEYPAPDHCG